jgi:uncharacterized membrane protein YfcA
MAVEPLLLAAVSGAIVAFLLTAFGGGGSVLATPLLLYWVGVSDPHKAIGTSAVAVAVNALFGLAAQARAGRVKWPCASVFAAAGLTGALLGAEIAKRIDGRQLLIGFAIAMAAVGAAMLRPGAKGGDPAVRLDRARVIRLTPVGFLTGAASGFFGIGGGFLIAPGLMAATGMTLANAAASSLLSVALFGAATSVSYAASGLVDWPLAGALIVGGIAGVVLGALAAPRLAARAALARRLFAGMILIVSAYVAWRALA